MINDKLRLGIVLVGVLALLVVLFSGAGLLSFSTPYSQVNKDSVRAVEEVFVDGVRTQFNDWEDDLVVANDCAVSVPGYRALYDDQEFVSYSESGDYASDCRNQDGVCIMMEYSFPDSDGVIYSNEVGTRWTEHLDALPLEHPTCVSLDDEVVGVERDGDGVVVGDAPLLRNNIVMRWYRALLDWFGGLL